MYCFYEQLVPFDVLTIECAEELFMILYILNITQPKHILDEIKFDHRLTGFSYE